MARFEPKKVAPIDRNHWHKSNRYIQQVEDYKKLMGYYPELVQTDDIYMTHANRNYLKEHGIRHTGRPLGRKPKNEKVSRYQKEKQRKEKAERNQIEGKFGQGKAGYNLGSFRKRLVS